MSNEIEMEDLKTGTKSRDQVQDAQPRHLELIVPDDEDVVKTVTQWAYATTLLLLALANLLIFFPRFLLFTSEPPTGGRATLTPLESYLALHSGFLLVALAMAILFSIPSGLVQQSAQRRVAASHPLLVPITCACIPIAFSSYNTTSVGSLAFFVFLGAGTIAAWGLWAIVFGGSSYVSKKTGADKRTSRFLFGNKAAASSQKKQWKKEQGKTS